MIVFLANDAHAQSTTIYAYDAQGRLVSVTRSDGPSTAYAYDGADNRTQRTIAVSGSVPNAFELGGPASAASGAWATSALVTVSGVSAAVPVTIAGGQYNINAGAWRTAAGSVSSGQTLQVRVQAPAAGGASQTATLDIGGVSDTFVVSSIVDTTPNAFNLGGPVTVAPYAWAETQPFTISGINVPVPITVAKGEYRIDSGAWVTTGGTVSAGQMVQMRVRAIAAGYSTSGTLAVSDVARTFTVTAAGVVIPPEGCTPPPGKDYCEEM